MRFVGLSRASNLYSSVCMCNADEGTLFLDPVLAGHGSVEAPVADTIEVNNNPSVVPRGGPGCTVGWQAQRAFQHQEEIQSCLIQL